MNESKVSLPRIGEKCRPLQVGFVPDSDCAPIILAQESGLFEKYELCVELRRETHWASIRDKVMYGDLDAAHAPATLPFVANLALESDHYACVSGMVLSLQGNAIAVSRELSEAGVGDATTLRDLVYRDWGRRTYTFGVAFPDSPSYFLLREWLKQGGIIPGIDVRIVVVPSTQLFPTLKLGYIDGFCGGEPWTSLVTESGCGKRLATSAELAPLHPEKVLMVRRDFAQERASEHERLMAALLEACAFCDQPKNYPVLSTMLSQPKYVNAPAACLEQGFNGWSEAAAQIPGSTGANIFHRYHTNDPTDAKASWLVERLYELMEESVLKVPAQKRTPAIKNAFRQDVYQRAKAIMSTQAQALQAEAEAYSAQSRIA